MSFKLGRLWWWYAWFVSTVAGSAALATLSWMALSLRFGYPWTFDVGFAATCGVILGVPLAVLGGLLNARRRPVWLVQAGAFGLALAVAVCCTLCLHIVIAVLPSMAVYLAVVALLSRSNRPTTDGSRCGRCGYDLRGLPEPRCPECGTPFVRPRS